MGNRGQKLIGAGLLRAMNFSRIVSRFPINDLLDCNRGSKLIGTNLSRVVPYVADLSGDLGAELPIRIIPSTIRGLENVCLMYPNTRLLVDS